MSIITAIWRRQPGDYFFLATKSGSGKWSDHAFKKEDLGGLQSFIDRNRDKDTYFCPHGFTKPYRQKKFAAMPRLLWADLDEVDPRDCKIKPTIAIESSPGRHAGLWVTDRPVTEVLNRDLSYFLGSDKGGWDVTQVLRVPGTINYKYQSHPKVRLLWSDGPSYRVSELRRKVPELEEDLEESDVSEIWRKYEAKLPAWARREVLNGRPQVGKRSEMIWKIEHALIDVGMSEEEVFSVIRASPWNKFKDRLNGDAQLKRELEKAYKGKLKSKPKNGYRFLETSMDEVEEENIDWLWYPYLARREVTIIEGDPGVGKSYLTQMIARHLCDGKRLPATKRMRPAQGKVAYFDVENSSSTVTKKRLKHNNLEHMENFYQEEEPFAIDDEDKTAEVYAGIERLQPIAAVFDTVNLYIGKADTGRGSDTTQSMAKFKDIADRFNCAVIVLRHLTKGSSKEKALYRGQGNIAFAGVARIVITVGCDPEDPDTRVLALTKNNLVRPCRALTFTIEELPDTLQEQDRSRFAWGDFVDLTSDDILAAPKEGNTERDDAVKFLEEELSDGQIEVSKIETMAEKRSISKRTLQRAATKLEVVRKTTGFGRQKQTFWSLPG